MVHSCRLLQSNIASMTHTNELCFVCPISGRFTCLFGASHNQSEVCELAVFVALLGVAGGAIDLKALSNVCSLPVDVCSFAKRSSFFSIRASSRLRYLPIAMRQSLFSISTFE